MQQLCNKYSRTQRTLSSVAERAMSTRRARERTHALAKMYATPAASPEDNIEQTPASTSAGSTILRDGNEEHSPAPSNAEYFLPAPPNLALATNATEGHRGVDPSSSSLDPALSNQGAPKCPSPVLEWRDPIHYPSSSVHDTIIDAGNHGPWITRPDQIYNVAGEGHHQQSTGPEFCGSPPHERFTAAADFGSSVPEIISRPSTLPQDFDPNMAIFSRGVSMLPSPEIHFGAEDHQTPFSDEDLVSDDDEEENQQ